MDNSKTIYRVIKDRENPYVMINKQFLNDNRLSWKAKGLLTYLLSMPDDWQIYEAELVKHSKDGLTSLKSGIKELIELGYIVREQLRNEKGQFKGYEYCVYESPAEIGFSNNGDSNNGEPHTTNNNITNNDLTNKERYIATKETSVPEEEKVTEDYPLENNEGSFSDIDREALEFYKLMPRQDGSIIEFILVYRKLRSKYSKKYLELILERYKKCKELKGENVFHRPDNFFRHGEYERYLDENWDMTLEECNRIVKSRSKQYYYGGKINVTEPQVSDEWDEQIENLGWD